MTDIDLALAHYDGNGDIPYCDLVWKALRLLQKYGTADAENRLVELPDHLVPRFGQWRVDADVKPKITMLTTQSDGTTHIRVDFALQNAKEARYD